MLIAVSGKGGVGKTSLAALILDEYARRRPELRALAVDADPAMTLHLALGRQQPPATLAGLRDATIFNRDTLAQMPPGQSRADYLLDRLNEQGIITTGTLREMPLDSLAMGRGEGRGCYCGVNNILAAVLIEIVSSYDLVVIDTPAGLEHLSRYILPSPDVFLVVSTPGPAALAVARQVVETVEQVGLKPGYLGLVLNQVRVGDAARLNNLNGGLPPALAHLLLSGELTGLELAGKPVIDLDDRSPLRQILWGALERINGRVLKLVPQA